jgi:hypothetical protein
MLRCLPTVFALFYTIHYSIQETHVSSLYMTTKFVGHIDNSLLNSLMSNIANWLFKI